MVFFWLGCYNRIVWVVLVAKREEVVMELSIELATTLPTTFDIELARYKYPVTYLESMNFVLHQEMIRFNKLTDVSFDLSTHPTFFSKCHLLIFVGMPFTFLRR